MLDTRMVSMSGLCNKYNPNQVFRYIVRYLGKPAIAASLTDSYNDDFVTFHYNRHEDETPITETLPALGFIAHLTQHIPESDQLLRRVISKKSIKFISLSTADVPLLPFHHFHILHSHDTMKLS